MSAKTFAYRLGEVRGLEGARAAYLGGTHATRSPAECAANSVDPQYATAGPEYAEFVDGYVTAWGRWFSAPDFLWAAPIEPPVIITQPTLRLALEAAFPDVNRIGFHDQLALFLIEHMTRETA